MYSCESAKKDCKRVLRRRFSPLLGVALIAFVTVLIPNVASAQAAVEARRQELSTKGKELFKETKNHCIAFRDLAAFSVQKETNVGDLIEDLKLVLIGLELTKRGTGKYYIGNTKGARGDRGFKKELQDGSPQVEHAFAAIYIGKTMPPGSTEALAMATEVMGPLIADGKLNPADVLLYAIGGDIGQRLATSNYHDLPKVIQKTMCE